MYLEHKEVTVGNGEIRVAEKNIDSHHYCPLKFLDAVSKL